MPASKLKAELNQYMNLETLTNLVQGSTFKTDTQQSLLSHSGTRHVWEPLVLYCFFPFPHSFRFFCFNFKILMIGHAQLLGEIRRSQITLDMFNMFLASVSRTRWSAEPWKGNPSLDRIVKMGWVFVVGHPPALKVPPEAGGWGLRHQWSGSRNNLTPRDHVLINENFLNYTHLFHKAQAHRIIVISGNHGILCYNW